MNFTKAYTVALVAASTAIVVFSAFQIYHSDMCEGDGESMMGHEHSGITRERGENMQVDPVCKMKVEEKLAAATYDYKGVKYYFCAKACKEKFARDPEKYLNKQEEKK